MSSKQFLNYPRPVQAADTPYTVLVQNNPALSGIPLTIVAKL